MPALSHFLPPVLHTGDTPPGGGTWSHWYLEPSAAALALGLAVAYLLWTGPLNRRRPGFEQRPITTRQTVSFLAGCAALLVALGPPLDDWSHFFLLSAHMVQHLILTMLVPPLLLLGLPAWIFEPIARRPLLDRIGRTLTRAPVAFIASALAIVVWHFPVPYDAALDSQPIHIAEHQLFLLTGLLGWWPVVGTYPGWPRLSPPVRCLYLFLQTIPSGVVGAVLTMADPGVYEAYRNAPARMWGWSLALDQEIAGLMMWVGANTIYLLLITVIFLRWAGAEEARDRRPRATLSQSSRSPSPPPSQSTPT